MASILSPRSAPLAKGFTSDVYAWGQGRVLKLFLDSVPNTTVEREFRTTRAVHAAGLLAPAAYELVEIEGRRGIVFERVDGISMFSHAQARPWTLLDAVRQLADLHAQIHRCTSPVELPSQREWIAGKIDASNRGTCICTKSARTDGETVLAVRVTGVLAGASRGQIATDRGCLRLP